MLGHERIQTTCVYTHVSLQELREVPSPMERLNEAGADQEKSPESDDAA
jgi:hypothetical protein